MNEWQITITVLGSLCTILSIILAILTFSKKTSKQKAEEAESLAEIKIDIKYIKEGVSELKTNTAVQSKKVDDLDKRLIIVEEKVKKLNAEEA